MGPHIYTGLLLACVAWLSWLTSLPLSVGGPTPSVGSGRSCLGQFSWAKGLHLPVSPWVGRGGLRASVGRPAVVLSLVRPYVFRASLPKRVLTGELARLLTDSACQAASPGRSRLSLTEWRQGVMMKACEAEELTPSLPFSVSGMGR